MSLVQTLTYSETTTQADSQLASLLPQTKTARVESAATPKLKFDRIREKVRGPITIRYWQEAEAQVDAWLEMVHTSLPVVESFIGAPLEGKLTLEMVSVQQFAANPVAGVLQVAGAPERDDIDKRLEQVSHLGYYLGRVLWYRASSDKNYLALSRPQPRQQQRGYNPFAIRNEINVDSQQRTPEWLLEAALLPLQHIWYDLATWQAHLKQQMTIYLQEKPRHFNLRKLSQKFTELSVDAPELARALSLLRGQSISQRCPDWQRRMSRALSIDFELNGLAALSLVTRTSLSEWEAIFLSDLERWQEAWC